MTEEAWVVGGISGPLGGVLLPPQYSNPYPLRTWVLAIVFQTWERSYSVCWSREAKPAMVWKENNEKRLTALRFLFWNSVLQSRVVGSTFVNWIPCKCALGSLPTVWSLELHSPVMVHVLVPSFISFIYWSSYIFVRAALCLETTYSTDRPWFLDPL